ncbi:MAG TPA: APC family permease [Jatrophihabitans sp.]|nr:APC family permease [Jatrophihabitans sp.]
MTASDTSKTVPGAVGTAEPERATLRRNLSVWQAVGLSIALMAPSMAANINPQPSTTFVGRAVPLSFLLAGVGVLFVSYTFVRLCQYYQHSGSVYAFVGLTLGARTGVVSGLALFATYVFYGVVTSSAAGLLGSAFLDGIGVWHNPPEWGKFVIAGAALLGALWLTIMPARRGTTTLLVIEGLTVALILAISVVVLVRVIGHSAPNGGSQHFTLSVFEVPKGTSTSNLFLAVVFGFLSFAGFEASSTLGEETSHPKRDIPRAILGTAIFGGIYFTVVTAIEMMGFGTSPSGLTAFAGSNSLLGDLGSSYIGSWVGDLVSLGAAISAFGCCLACMVGAARLLFAMNRDLVGTRGLGQVSGQGTPARAAGVVLVLMGGMIALDALAFGAQAEDTFAWSGTMGTLILLVAYILATVGVTRLLFVQKKMPVPTWQVIIPVIALVILGYTIYRNVIPYPASGEPSFWFPIVAGGWILLCVLAVLASPGPASRLGARLAGDEGFATGAEPGAGPARPAMGLDG